MKKNLLFFIPVMLICMMANAQSENEAAPFGPAKFLLTGNAEAIFYADSGRVNFGDVNFKPILLWKLSDKLFIESEVEFETGDGEVAIGLEYANMCYQLNQYMTIHGGRFLPKFGAYRGKLGESFINRFASNPVGYGDGGIGPMDEVGVGIQGGIPLGSAKMNYDIWVSDGPQLFNGTEGDPSAAGQFEYEAYTDNNKNKAIGGRLGLLPFSNSSLELGFSYENAGKTGPAYSDYEKVGVNMMAVDLNYFHAINPIKSTFRLVGEYKQQDVDKFNYPVADDTAGATYTFDNSASAWYGMFSIRPSAMDNKYLRNFELAFRYSEFTPPKDALWGGAMTNQTAVALDYWLRWNSVIKFVYQKQKKVTDQFFVQLVYGF